MQMTLMQITEIKRMLASGMTPESVADSLSRMADLDDGDRFQIRDVAVKLKAGEPL